MSAAEKVSERKNFITLGNGVPDRVEVRDGWFGTRLQKPAGSFPLLLIRLSSPSVSLPSPFLTAFHPSPRRNATRPAPFTTTTTATSGAATTLPSSSISTCGGHGGRSHGPSRVDQTSLLSPPNNPPLQDSSRTIAPHFISLLKL